MQVLTPRRRNLHHDDETFSFLSLPDVGLDRYVRHFSTELLMTAYAFDDEPVRQWVPEEGEAIPAELEDALLDERVVKHAWNAAFEREVWKHVWGVDVPIEQWRDTMVLAMAFSLPGKLERAGPILKLDDEHLKMKDGKTLMNWFSKRRPATTRQPIRRVYWYQQPERWERYKLYNRRDVESERRIYHKLKDFDLPEHEWELWYEDQRINERGIPVDFEFAQHCEQTSKKLIATRIAKMNRKTGLQNANAPQQLLPWLQDRGYPFNDLKKGHVRRAVASLKEEGGGKDVSEIEALRLRDLKEVLELRLEAAQAAVKKYSALVSHANEDDWVLRHTLQFCGAQRTWRWGGRVFQPHNLVKPVGYLEGLEWSERSDGASEVSGGPLIDCRQSVARLGAALLDMLYRWPMDYLSACVRPTVCAPDGYLLIDADLSAIENVVLGWLADDQRILRVFKNGLDPYIDFATYLFHQSYEELWAEFKAGKKKKRTTAKPGVLGCGYMLGAGHQYEDEKTGEIEATGLLGYAWNMGIRDFTSEEAKRSVDVWRATYEQTTQFWDDVQAAVFRTVNTKRSSAVRHLGFDMKRGVLRMHLPSNRCLHYIRPKIVDMMMPWGKKKPNFTYEGKNARGGWSRVSSHPGKITENGDQAVARDLLAHGIMNARKENIDVRFHVHDQIVGLSKEDRAGEELATLIQCMIDRPYWGRDIPVSAAGHISKWFVKD